MTGGERPAPFMEKMVLKGERKFKLENTQQNSWFVVKYLRREKGRQIYWCRCDCGTEKEVISNGGSLLSKCCGCRRVPNWKKGLKSPEENIDIYSSLRTRYKKDAKARNFEFTLTNDEFKHIIIQPCYYCGSEKESKQMYNNWGYVYYTGIDRVNNLLGYTLENSVPCCKECNFLKKSVTPNIIKKAYKFLFEKQDSNG